MYIDRIIAPITSLGPGKRLVLWTRGCSKHCKNCANPELWSTEGAKNRKVKDIVQIIKNLMEEEKLSGITISGGDPLEQREEILSLLEELGQITEDILLYTGYRLEELEQIYSKEEMALLKENVTVLIDGPYMDEKNDGMSALRGSANQKIYFFKAEYEALYEEYMKGGRKIQNVYMGENLVSVGIHNR